MVWGETDVSGAELPYCVRVNLHFARKHILDGNSTYLSRIFFITTFEEC